MDGGVGMSLCMNCGQPVQDDGKRLTHTNGFAWCNPDLHFALKRFRISLAGAFVPPLRAVVRWLQRRLDGGSRG